MRDSSIISIAAIDFSGTELQLSDDLGMMEGHKNPSFLCHAAGRAQRRCGFA
jgi:hypothetical protein